MVNDVASPSALLVETVCSRLRADGIEISPERVEALDFRFLFEKENDHWSFWIFHKGVEISFRDFLIEIAADSLVRRFKNAVNEQGDNSAR